MAARNTASLLQMLATGLQGGMEGMQIGQQWNEQARQRALQDQQLAQQAEDRKIQQASNRLSLLAKLAEGQREGTWDAAFSNQAWQQAGYAPMTTTMQVPRPEKEYVGQVEANRPDPSFVGPMPGVKGFRTVYDPKEVSIFDSIKQTPKVHQVGGSLVDSTGKVVYQAPPKQAEAKPRMGWITQPDGSQTWGELVTGVKSHPKPTATRQADPLVTEERRARLRDREDKKQERLEANLRKRAEGMVPRPLASHYVIPEEYEQAIASRNDKVEAVYQELLRKAQGKGQAPKPAPAASKSRSLVDTLKAGGLL